MLITLEIKFLLVKGLLNEASTLHLLPLGSHTAMLTESAFFIKRIIMSREN